MYSHRHLSKLNRVLQLASANLPVGSFTFSQGLETAIDKGWINDAASCEDWLNASMNESLAKLDLPVIKRMMAAFNHEDTDLLTHWNDYLLASRETSELLLTDTMTGRALVRLLVSLDERFAPQREWIEGDQISYCSAFALAASGWGIPYSTALYGFAWAYLDGQLAAATKLIPLGQTDNQKLLLKMGDNIEALVHKALAVDDDDIGGSQFQLAMASSWHETQYSRLFRS